MSSPLQIQIKAEVDKQDIKICRFTVDRPVHSGSATFNSAEEAKDNDLAAKLFLIPGISRVELDGYNVAVSQSGAEDWRQLGKRIGSAIRNFLNPPPEIPEGDRLPPDHVRTRVQQVLDEMINPGVASHGGFVELLDVQDDNVFIRMGGGCQGCGAADVTLKQGIERLIRENVPQVREILDTTDHGSGQNPFYAPSK
ncbi:MAG TPA: NifU family protein [Blastocatellia bacterium]|jgi:Fe-S cluster biogenesis protein NfuA|nr:NifU family protein [Blastocatellia bacterium]